MTRVLSAVVAASALATAVAHFSSAAPHSSVAPTRTASGIAYERQGEGPAVILIPGSSLDKRMWNREVEWLKRRFTVVRYDLRAHGESTTPTEPFSHLDDLTGLLDALKFDRATLIGLSAGATIALDAALAMPERIDRVVLVGPAISGYVPKERPAFFSDLVAALKARDYAKANEVMIASPLLAVPSEAQPLVRAMVTQNDRLWSLSPALMKRPPPAADRLEELRVPALILVGDQDLEPQKEQARLIAERAPRARLTIVPGGGHLLNLTSPVAFEEAVSRFLQ